MNDAKSDWMKGAIHCAICGNLMTTAQMQAKSNYQDGKPLPVWRCPACAEWLSTLANPDEHWKLGINDQAESP